MDIKFHITKYLAVSALAMPLLGACSKNNVYINYPNEENNEDSSGSGSDGNNNNPAGENALIAFSASVEERNIARATSPARKGLQSWLCAYTANTSNNITGTPVAQGNYVTSSPGILTGNLGYKMHLNNAIYGFYAAPYNSTSPTPILANGLSEPLSNGVDYFRWYAAHQDIASSQINIPVAYQHVVAQVVVMIIGGENIALNRILSATITPPKPGTIMGLSTGTITSGVSYNKVAGVRINDFTVQYIMLPIKSSSPMTLTLKLMVNGESFSRTYTTPLTPPSDLLSTGSPYLFWIAISENSISFANVSVKEWTEVDENGSPLYPVQD